MKNGAHKLLVIGSLPPPHIGPTVATEKLLAAEKLTSRFDVRFLDLSDSRGSANIGRFDWGNASIAIVHILQFLARLIFFRPRIVYLNVSQGIWGYVRDLGFMIPSALTGRRMVIHLRGSEFNAFYKSMNAGMRWVTRFVFRRVDCVIVLGNSIRHAFEGLIDDARVRVVPNGIDYTVFDVGDRAARKNDHFHVLYLSSLRKRKGIFEFLEALPIVMSKHPNVRVTIAGEWRTSEEEEKAKSLLEANGIATSVDFVGACTGEEKVQTFLEHDLFVFPPIEPEGLPWVLLEAMSAALPVISTDKGAISEVVEDRKTGFIIEPTAPSIAKSVCEVVENPDQAREMGVQGRKRVEELFSEDLYVQRIVDIMTEVAR